MTTKDLRKERLRIAAEKIIQKKKEEAEKDQQFYEKLTTGKTFKFFVFTAIFSLLVGILLLADPYINGKVIPLDSSDYSYERVYSYNICPAIWVGDDIFDANYAEFISVDYESFALVRSRVFGNAQYISYTAHTLDKPERFIAYKRYSILRWYPFVQLLFFIPILVVLFKRKSTWFVFMRKLSLLLIFPAGIFLIIRALFL